MVCTLTNEFYDVCIKPEGAELTSIKDKHGHEYLWQADASVWNRHAPILFPIVGALKNGVYTYKGRSYSLSQHGFARDTVFTLLQNSDNYAEFQLKSDLNTLRNYPFEFDFRVIYELKGNTLVNRFEVRNSGAEDMLFSLGGHPAFNLNWLDGDSIEDYYIEFDQPETLPLWTLDNSLLSNTSEPYLNNDKVINLHESIFDRDALIFLDHKSKSIALKHKTNGRSLTVDISEFPHLGIWAKPSAPYVCIEPWQGHVDPEGHNGQLRDKPGIVELPQGDIYRAGFSICITGL